MAALKQLRKKWRDWSTRNKKLIPFATIEKAVGGKPEAVDTTLRHYKGYIKYCSVFQWNFNANIQDRLEAQLIKTILQFHFDR